MADDNKRIENICTKVTEQMLVDIHRELARHDVKLSSWLYGLIRRQLYGVSARSNLATLESEGD